jgi:hypothetical protein
MVNPSLPYFCLTHNRTAPVKKVVAIKKAFRFRNKISSRPGEAESHVIVPAGRDEVFAIGRTAAFRFG